MGARENAVMNECMIALSAAGCLVFRNSTGVLPGANGRPVRFGLAVGSSDLIGLCPDGTFLAIETKTAKGRATDAQHAFIAAVQRRGGRAGIARTGAEAVAIARGPAGLPSG